MRIERERERFVCAECGNEIEFGDDDAVCYDNEIYCSFDCAKDAAGIDYYDWDDESEFTERIIPEELISVTSYQNLVKKLTFSC